MFWKTEKFWTIFSREIFKSAFVIIIIALAIQLFTDFSDNLSER